MIPRRPTVVGASPISRVLFSLVPSTPLNEHADVPATADALIVQPSSRTSKAKVDKLPKTQVSARGELKPSRASFILCAH